jgi:hypothetical protein
MTFTRMDQTTREDWQVIGREFMHLAGDLREQFRGHPCFARTEEFCALYDNPAFNPDGPTLPLSAFEPMLRRVFAHPRRSVYQEAKA